MTYLLDTHAFIWAITDPGKLSPVARKIIRDPAQSIVVSAVSFWEISMKFGLGKLYLEGISPEDFPEVCIQTGMEILPLEAEVCASYHRLVPAHHRDPFDKMLIWLAKSRNYTLISKDEKMGFYAPDVQVVW